MRADLAAQIEATRQQVRVATSKLTPHPFGHAFLWGTIEVKLKNGKTKAYRSLLCSVCTDDLSACVKIAESVPGVSRVDYNLD